MISLYCYPTKENVVTKLAFATEEIYKLHEPETKRLRPAQGDRKETM